MIFKSSTDPLKFRLPDSWEKPMSLFSCRFRWMFPALRSAKQGLDATWKNGKSSGGGSRGGTRNCPGFIRGLLVKRQSRRKIEQQLSLKTGIPVTNFWNEIDKKIVAQFTLQKSS